MQKSTHRLASREKYDVIKNFPDHISNFSTLPDSRNSRTVPSLWECCVCSDSVAASVCNHVCDRCISRQLGCSALLKRSLWRRWSGANSSWTSSCCNFPETSAPCHLLVGWWIISDWIASYNASGPISNWPIMWYFQSVLPKTDTCRYCDAETISNYFLH